MTVLTAETAFTYWASLDNISHCMWIRSNWQQWADLCSIAVELQIALESAQQQQQQQVEEELQQQADKVAAHLRGNYTLSSVPCVIQAATCNCCVPPGCLTAAYIACEHTHGRP